MPTATSTRLHKTLTALRRKFRSGRFSFDTFIDGLTIEAERLNKSQAAVAYAMARKAGFKFVHWDD